MRGAGHAGGGAWQLAAPVGQARQVGPLRPADGPTYSPARTQRRRHCASTAWAVQLPGGDILCPSSTEHQGWQVHVERTPDLGKTWQATPPLNDGQEIAAIQPSILVHGAGRLQAVGRTRQGKVFETWSQDGGRTWGRLSLTALPNPNSGTGAVTLADGRHLIVYNHTARGRSPLNVAVSSDGKAWKAAVVLEESGRGAGGRAGQFS